MKVFKEASGFRGDVPAAKSKQYSKHKNIPCFDDSTCLNGPTIASLTGSTAHCSYQSTSKSCVSEISKRLKRAEFKGGAHEPDKLPDDCKIKQTCLKNHGSALHDNYLTVSQPALQRPHVTRKGDTDQCKLDNKKQSSRKSGNACPAYNKPFYAVLVGNSVRVYNTKLYASLPFYDKYMVKERVRDNTGNTKIKMTLKSTVSDSIL